jgi:hypothetical protein
MIECSCGDVATGLPDGSKQQNPKSESNFSKAWFEDPNFLMFWLAKQTSSLANPQLPRNPGFNRRNYRFE